MSTIILLLLALVFYWKPVYFLGMYLWGRFVEKDIEAGFYLASIREWSRQAWELIKW